jgi:hypothetical protein
VGIKVTERKFLHLREHLAAHFIEEALSDYRHKARVRKVRNKSDDINADHRHDRRRDTAAYSAEAFLQALVYKLKKSVHKQTRDS